ncbi:hypothetical protein OAW32_02885 [bacterium]|nr:hypothetical protein [bacterium]
MKTDAYTKVVLTGIAVFLGFIAFDYKPSMKAEAGIMGGGEMIMSDSAAGFWHLRDGKLRWCIGKKKYSDKPPRQYLSPECAKWSDG